jgi:hypothetical protein
MVRAPHKRLRRAWIFGGAAASQQSCGVEEGAKNGRKVLTAEIAEKRRDRGEQRKLFTSELSAAFSPRSQRLKALWGLSAFSTALRDIRHSQHCAITRKVGNWNLRTRIRISCVPGATRQMLLQDSQRRRLRYRRQLFRWKSTAPESSAIRTTSTPSACPTPRCARAATASAPQHPHDRPPWLG